MSNAKTDRAIGRSTSAKNAIFTRRVAVGLGSTLGAIILTVGLIPNANAAADPEAQWQKSQSRTGNLYNAGQTQLLTGPTTRARVSSRSANARIAKLIKTRLRSSAVGSKYSYRVTDVASGQSIANRRGTHGHLPASTNKIMTAAAILQVLGPSHRFSTKVVSLGKGKVALIGGGDATLSRGNLDTIARELALKLRANDSLAPAPGKKLEIYFDDSLYPKPTKPGGWTNSYQPGIVRPVRPLGTLGQYVWDSSSDAASHFRSRVATKTIDGKKISTISKGRTKAPKNANVLVNFKGATLSNQINTFLQVSENNIGEMLFRNVAVAKGKSASWGGSRQAVRDVLTRDLRIPLGNTKIEDGSGVSRRDRLNARALTSALNRAADKKKYPNLAPIYHWGSLPLAGVTGTLASGNGRYNTRPTSCARGKIRAKTGTLHDTVGLAGLTVGRDGRLKSFAILVNSRPKRYSPLQTRRIVDRGAATVHGCY